MSDSQQLNRLPSQVQTEMPFFEVDFNFKPMKGYINNLSTVVNQNADLTETIIEELKKQCTTKVVQQQISTLNQNASIPNNILMDIVSKTLKPKSSSNQLENETLGLSLKLQQIAYGVDYNFRQNQNIQDRLAELEKENALKLNKGDFQDKQSKLKQNVQQQINDLQNDLSKQNQNSSKELKNVISAVKDDLSEVEKNTLWRICNCEEELKKRITVNYVNDSIKQLDEKITRTVLNNIKSDSEKIDQLTDKLNQKLVNVENSLLEKHKNNKKNIEKNAFEIANNVVNKTSLKDLKQSNSNSINDLSKRIKELEKNSNLHQEIDQLMKKIRNLEQQIADNQTEMSDKITNYFQTMSQAGGSGTNGKSEDIHQFCKIQGDIIRNTEDISKLSKQLMNQDEKLQTKLTEMQNSLFELLHQRGEDKNNDIYKNIQEVRTELLGMLQNNDKKLSSDLASLMKRIETFAFLEKKVGKIMKDFDINVINKKLDSKANKDDVMKDFAIMDTKINRNSEQILYLRKDIDNIIFSIKKLTQQSQQSNDMGSILTTKKLNPTFNMANCLSCGFKTNGNNGNNGNNFASQTTNNYKYINVSGMANKVQVQLEQNQKNPSYYEELNITKKPTKDRNQSIKSKKNSKAFRPESAKV